MPDNPNILIIWGDDIGISNLSCYSEGLMGYRTPNIDRIAAEGVRFTDYYGEQSCTAGRAAFITGQNPYRTGLTKVGMPGADIALRAGDPTIATALKALGYTTGQFGMDQPPSRRRGLTLLCAGESPRRRGRVQLRPAQPQFRIDRKVIKGGSHLCADSYCLRYRPAARRPQMVDTGMSHLGFRCVRRGGGDSNGSSASGDERASNR